MSSGLQICSWNDAQFAASRDAWQRLLASSDADPLFMSWDWQWRWWRHHVEYLGASLHVSALYAAGELVGIAPFYSRKVRLAGRLRLWRMELLGQAWRDGDSVFSEYLDLIAARGYEPAVIECVAQWLRAERHWDDLALTCVKTTSLASRLARERLTRFAYVRSVDPMIAYSTNLPGTFTKYTQALSSGARRKLLNQRSKLREPMIVAAGPNEIDGFMQTLRAFEAARWGSKSDRLYRFNHDFALYQASAGGLRLTKLVAEGRTLSVMYNVRIGDTEYYLQSAFDPQASRGLSTGYLHFGYRIESACLEGVTCFDFLAGRGRNRDYKHDLLTTGSPLVSCHIIRANWLRALHRVHRALVGWRSHLQRS